MADSASTATFIQHARTESVPELLKMLKLLKPRKQRSLIAAAVADADIPEDTREGLNRVIVLDAKSAPSDPVWLQDSKLYWQRMNTEACEF